MRTLLGRRHIHCNINTLATRAEDNAVHRRDIGIVASDRQDHVLVGGNDCIGRVEPDPAGFGSAPHQNPRMHGVGALQSRGVGPGHCAQIAADIDGRQPDAAQSGNHDVGEILADAAAQRKRHRRRGGDGRGADLVDDIGFETVHHLDGGVEHRPADGKALPRIVANLRIKRHHAARKQEMCRRQRSDVAGCKRLVADRFPGRRRQRVKLDRRVDGDARCQFDCDLLVRLFDFDPGQAVAEKIQALAPVPRFWHDLQGRDMHSLTGARDRPQAQDVARMRKRRGVGAGRRLPDVLDHAGASQADSEGSLVGR